MIHSVNSFSASGVDPFKSFEVEFGQALQSPKGLTPVAPDGPDFGTLVNQALGAIQNEEHKAEQLAFDFATGKPVDIHTMMIQVAKADTLMQLTSAVVSKTAQGLNTLLQTQV